MYKKFKSSYFTDCYYVFGAWDIKFASSFPHREFLAADTETKLIFNNKVIDDDEAYRIYKEKGAEYFKLNVSVYPYAFILSDGENTVIFQNIRDFLSACSMFNVKTVFWYNAKFDFSIFDYYFLIHKEEFNDITLELQNNERYRKLPHGTYQNLAGDFGQRYQMRVWFKYINRRNQQKVHNFKMIDICNVSPGGLAKNLENWNIVDHNNEPVRKLEMNYSGGSIETDYEYMINDAKGLFLLAETLEKTFSEITGYSLFDGDYLTAGGLAKKTLLKNVFNRIQDRENIEAFRLCFPMNFEKDSFYRENDLYKGGKCFINPKYTGKVVKHLYKYDVNSMYPNELRNMTYPIGEPKKLKKLPRDKKDKLYIVAVENLRGFIKAGMVPVFQDSLSDEYTDSINNPELRLFWYEELETLEKFYDLDYDIKYALEFPGSTMPGMRRFIDLFYDIKKHSKGAKRNCAKIILNSSYGKLAQRADRLTITYDLNDLNVVHAVSVDEVIDEKGLMSVIVGSRVTALARVDLMNFILKICTLPERDFVYCDTDSIISLTPFDETDDSELGKMKYEGKFKYGLFLAPKSYLLQDYDNKFDVHCKGVNVKSVKKELEGITDFKKAVEIFRPNRLFKSLSGINVRGGKALVYIDKMIVNDEYLTVDITNIEKFNNFLEQNIDNVE